MVVLDALHARSGREVACRELGIRAVVVIKAAPAYFNGKYAGSTGTVSVLAALHALLAINVAYSFVLERAVLVLEALHAGLSGPVTDWRGVLAVPEAVPALHALVPVLVAGQGGQLTVAVSVALHAFPSNARRVPGNVGAVSPVLASVTLGGLLVAVGGIRIHAVRVLQACLNATYACGTKNAKRF